MTSQYPVAHPGRPHQWDCWSVRPSTEQGRRIPVDPHDGSYQDPVGQRAYRYRRECQLLGCSAVELADELQAVGRNIQMEKPERST